MPILLRSIGAGALSFAGIELTTGQAVFGLVIGALSAALCAYLATRPGLAHVRLEAAKLHDTQTQREKDAEKAQEDEAIKALEISLRRASLVEQILRESIHDLCDHIAALTLHARALEKQISSARAAGQHIDAPYAFDYKSLSDLRSKEDKAILEIEAKMLERRLQ